MFFVAIFKLVAPILVSVIVV